mmetsp:Transcript_33570/g.105722  ORF Transcript_33570/g.105722 Transcript_33570/m.105722 type:complete len:337 (+) Transcript_33570:315-1325(+)
MRPLPDGPLRVPAAGAPLSPHPCGTARQLERRQRSGPRLPLSRRHHRSRLRRASPRPAGGLGRRDGGLPPHLHRTRPHHAPPREPSHPAAVGERELHHRRRHRRRHGERGAFGRGARVQRAGRGRLCSSVVGDGGDGGRTCRRGFLQRAAGPGPALRLAVGSGRSRPGDRHGGGGGGHASVGAARYEGRGRGHRQPRHCRARRHTLQAARGATDAHLRAAGRAVVSRERCGRVERQRPDGPRRGRPRRVRRRLPPRARAPQSRLCTRPLAAARLCPRVAAARPCVAKLLQRGSDAIADGAQSHAFPPPVLQAFRRLGRLGRPRHHPRGQAMQSDVP